MDSLATQVKQLLDNTRVCQCTDISKRVLLPANQVYVLPIASSTACMTWNIQLKRFPQVSYCNPVPHPPQIFNSGTATRVHMYNVQAGSSRPGTRGFTGVQSQQDNAHHPTGKTFTTRLQAAWLGDKAQQSVQYTSIGDSYLLAILRRMRRMILPERVLGMPGAQ